MKGTLAVRILYYVLQAFVLCFLQCGVELFLREYLWNPTADAAKLVYGCPPGPIRSANEILPVRGRPRKVIFDGCDL